MGTSGIRYEVRRGGMLLALVLVGAGCVHDDQSLLIANAIRPDPDDSCLVEVSMNSSEGDVKFEEDVLAVGAWEISIRSNYWLYPELLNLLQPTRDIANLKGEANVVRIDSYEVRYDWGEDLSYDLGPGSDPWALGITDRYRDVISVSVPPGGTFIPAVQLVPTEVGTELVQATFWDLQAGNRRFKPSFRAILKFFGTTSGDREVESNEFLFRVEVERGAWNWVYVVPSQQDCCTSDMNNTACTWGQDDGLDCRLVRDYFDSVFPTDQTVVYTEVSEDEEEGDVEIRVEGRSRCCPVWPDLCDKLDVHVEE